MNKEQNPPKSSQSAGLTGYAKYRGKCKEAVEEICKTDPSLTPVRGYYICWSWGKQAHWWAIKPDGTIVDPTVDQFPKPHIGDYIPFDGLVYCAECGKEMAEGNAHFYGNYAFCSTSCNMRFVGL